MFDNIVFPRPLGRGDTVAVCSPAGPADAGKVAAAVGVLEGRGWRVRVMPHALGSAGMYAADMGDRLSDMTDALVDPDVRCVLCSRGGYGAVHILGHLDELDLRRDPKWIVGFSDISALHALWARHGIASVHASMAAHVMLGEGDPDNAALFGILEGRMPAYSFGPCRQYDRPGLATGRLVGGNLAVLSALIGTPYDIFGRGTVLFIEDISEPIYKIERMLYQLRLSGVLGALAGLIVGRFTDYVPSRSYNTMEQMIADMVAPYDYPVAFDAPIGHIDHNIPLVESATVTLRVSPDNPTSLVFHPHNV